MRLIFEYLTKAILWGCLLIGIVFQSCDESGLSDCMGESNGDITAEGTEEVRVSFTASLNQSSTKNLVSFPKGAKASIFTFISGGSYIGNKDYVADVAGSLSAIDTELNLTTGRYDFYATSVGTSEHAPFFSNGVAKDLKNGVDYLWGGIWEHTIKDRAQSIPIEFRHVATQIVLNFKEGQIEKMNFINVQQPHIDDSNVWTLASGVITPASSLDPVNMLSMTMDGNVCKTEMLPIEYNGTLNVEMNVKLIDIDIAKNYSLKLLLPDNQLEAGKSYAYYVEFKNNEPILAEVNIAPWKNYVFVGDINVPVW